MTNMFYNCTQLTQLDVSNWDTSSVKDMNSMFQGCTSLTQLDVSGFNTSSVTSMNNIFYYCSNLTSLDVSNFDTSKVANMDNMFYGCTKLTQLDLSSFKTNLTRSMFCTFYNCKALTTLDISNWDTSNVTTMGSFLSACPQLTNIGLIYSDINTINSLPTTEAMTLYVDSNIDQESYTGVSTLKAYQEKSITINIPMALRSNGDIADRFYWNDEDKHYYIEQWIDPITEKVLESPSLIATGITTPLEIKQYVNEFTIDIKQQTPSYMNITTPHFYIPDDYEYKEEDEVEYFKQSFELRFPDEDDVGGDWGFAHVNGDRSMGLKRVIDWVDKCDDETFVRDFDKYFHRQYTLRYFLLVITLG